MRLTTSVFARRVALCVTWVALVRTLGSVTVAAEPAAGSAIEQVQSVVDRLRAQLGISQTVTVALVPKVALVVAVEAPTEPSAPFRLAIEEAFLDRLSADEVDAVVAHELGHVWVFTHHPYLQTEQLANQIAMRVVPRGTLENVYRKLWEHGGTTGDLATLIGP